MEQMVIALLLLVNNEIKEARLQPDLSTCLSGKRKATRQVSDNIEYRWLSVNQETYIRMIDRLLGNIFGWFDKLNEKLNEVLTFDYPKPKPRRKKKCKDCHCQCHCKAEFHLHHWDGDVCTCEECICTKKSKKK